MPPDLSFLPRQERKTASLGIAAVALVLAGWVARGILLVEAHAGENTQIARDVAELKTNVARIMDRMGIDPEPKMPPLRTSGPSR